MTEYVAVTSTIILQAILNMNHAPAVIAAYTAAQEGTSGNVLDVVSPATVGAGVLIGVHHVVGIVREKAKLD